jgi:Zn-finger nucleic acid-binding protein
MSSERLCPRCGAQLAPVSLLEGGRIEVDVCPCCRGTWFDATELDEVMAAAQADAARVDRRLLSGLAERNAVPEVVRYLKCPACGKIMNRCSYGFRSGVVVDRCKADGVWLDGGELERLFDWAAAGGHVLSAQVAEERRQDEARREARRRERLAASGPLDDPDEVLGMYPRRRSGGWLAGALGDLLESMLRSPRQRPAQSRE